MFRGALPFFGRKPPFGLLGEMGGRIFASPARKEFLFCDEWLVVSDQPHIATFVTTCSLCGDIAQTIHGK
jgi:hypothetical protein